MGRVSRARRIGTRLSTLDTRLWTLDSHMIPDPSGNSFELSFTDRQSAYLVEEEPLLAAVRAILHDSAYATAVLSIVIVDGPEIHALNRQYLEHDYPTDVLSFVLEQQEDHLEGEVIVCSDVAFAEAPQYGWTIAEELLLYVIHGTLHLVGYHDKTAEDIAKMRHAESHYLHQLGTCQPVTRDEPLVSNLTTGESRS